MDNPVVILKAGVYNQEISDDILNNINPNTIFGSDIIYCIQEYVLINELDENYIIGCTGI